MSQSNRHAWKIKPVRGCISQRWFRLEAVSASFSPLVIPDSSSITVPSRKTKIWTSPREATQMTYSSPQKH